MHNRSKNVATLHLSTINFNVSSHFNLNYIKLLTIKRNQIVGFCIDYISAKHTTNS